MVQLKYIGSFDLWFPKLTRYRGGVTVKKGDIIKLEKNESESILKTRKNLFEVVRPVKEKPEE